MTDFAKEARDLAVDSVDRAIGYTIEFAFAPALHRRLYDEFEAVLSQTRAAGIAEGMAKAAEIATTCNGIEQEKFEAWAKAQGYDRTTHPLHWLFLDPETYAAREGWRAAMNHVREAILAAAPPKES